MNKIQQLIQQYCPNGVEFKELQEVFDIKNGYTPSKSNSEFWENGTIPWFRMEDIRANGRVLSDSIQHITPESVKGSGLFAANSIIVSTSATIGEHALITVDFLANQRFTCLTRKSDYTDRLDMLFFQNYMFLVDEWCKNNINISGFAGVDMPKFKKLKIPIPPIAVQQEIAYILDSFTQLEAELEAELEARRAQYEYYRNRLLSATELNGKWLMNGVEVEWKTLGEVISALRTGLNPRQNFKLNNAEAKNFYVTVRELNGFTIKITDKTDKVDSLGLKLIQNRSKIQIGDILFSGTGTIGRTALVNDFPNNWNIKEGIYVLTPITNIINAKFLIYLLQSSNIYNQIIAKADGSTVSSISMASLQKIQIPIPPLAEQERIVGILDKFDALVNDISIGLPAEIDGRRKQYNYYRGKLLDFKPVVSDKRLVVNENPLNTNH